MRLLLASVAANMMDKFIKYIPDRNAVVGFIANASDNESDTWYVKKDKDKLIELGFKIIDIDLKDKTRLSKDIKKVSIIFVAGGNTFYLLEKTLESGFDKILKNKKNKDMIYIGSSAGTALVGPTIEHVKLIDDPSQAKNLKSYDGIALIGKLVFVHADDAVCAKVYKKIYKDYSSRYDCIKLNDFEGLVIDGDSVKKIKA